MAADAAGSSSLSVPELQRQLAELAEELRVHRAAKQAALQREAAIADVLRIVNSASGSLAPVFQAILEKAMDLCGASFGGLWTFDADRYVAVALHGVPRSYSEFLSRNAMMPGPGSAPYRFLRGERGAIQNADLADDDLYRAGDLQRRALVDLGGARTALHVPLCKDEKVIGVLTIYRQQVGPFDDRQIELLQTFSAQIVLAMENARLLSELREALEQQTATAAVLQVINASPGNLAPVFDAMLEKAMTLCGAAFGFLTSYDGQRFTAVAMRGVPPSLAKYFTKGMDQPSPGEMHFRILQGEDVIHNLDQKDEEAYRSGLPLRRAVVDLGGGRTALIVALRKDGAVLGALTIYRKEVRPFSDKQIALMRDFAAQAVVAIENARLLSEQHEALERQTATAEVLQVINSSPGNLGPVFDAMLERALRLCEASCGHFRTFDGELLHLVAARGVPDAYAEFLRTPVRPYRENQLGRILRGEQVVVSVDAADEEPYRAGDALRRAFVDLGGARSTVTVALAKDKKLLGTLTVYRQEVRPFSDKHIALLQNFAAQAVIAMENARLLMEQREALEQQTATAEILRVISQSPADVNPVLTAVARAALRFCGATDVVITLRDGDHWLGAAHEGPLDSVYGERHLLSRETAPGRAMIDSQTVHLPDIPALDPSEFATTQRMGARLGFRASLAAPMLREGVAIGAIVLRRPQPGPFTPRQIELLESFAAQAVIAIENVRLFTETREAAGAANSDV